MAQCLKCKSKGDKIYSRSHIMWKQCYTTRVCSHCGHKWETVQSAYDLTREKQPKPQSYSYVAIDGCKPITQEEFNCLYLQKPPKSDKLNNSELFLEQFKEKTTSIPPSLINSEWARPNPNPVYVETQDYLESQILLNLQIPLSLTPSQEPKMKQIHISQIFEAWHSVEPQITKLVLKDNVSNEAVFWKHTCTGGRLSRLLEHDGNTQIVGSQWPPEPPKSENPSYKYVLSSRDKPRPPIQGKEGWFGRMYFSLQRNCWENCADNKAHPTLCADLVIVRRPVTCDDFGKEVTGTTEDGREFVGKFTGILFDKETNRRIHIVENYNTTAHVYRCEI